MAETDLCSRRKTVLFEDYKLGVLQRVLLCSALAFFFSCPMMLSSVGRIIGFFLMIELLVLCVWVYAASRKADNNHRRQDCKTVDMGVLVRRVRVAWAAFVLFVIVATIVGVFVRPHTVPKNVYDWFVFVGDYAAPLLLFPIPSVFNCLYLAARDNSDSEEENEVRRRRSNLIVVVAVVVAFLASYAMLFYAAPAISKYSPAYEQNQKNILYHDISAVTSYKNTSDVNGLFRSLPMSDALRDVTCDRGLLHAVYDGVEETEIKRLVLYNATAATALLDRVQTLRFTVNGTDYEFAAEKIIALYDDFAGILKGTTWRSVVTAPLSDKEETDKRFATLSVPENKPEPEPILVTVLPNCRVNEGNLILVNYAHSYDGEQAETFTDLRGVFPKERFKYNDPAFLVPSAAKALELMFMDYDVNADEGKTVRVNSAYRSSATQQDLYEKYRRQYGQNYVDQYVAIAHYSEHQTGLGIDITNSEYLAENCWKFGFVRRYQEDKVSVTHTSNEKWHYRYVGILHAKFMTEQNLCLEEYIDLLHTKTQKDPLMIDGVRVFHIPEDGNVVVPVGTTVVFSGDNVDGYVVSMILPNGGE